METARGTMGEYQCHHMIGAAFHSSHEKDGNHVAFRKL